MCSTVSELPPGLCPEDHVVVCLDPLGVLCLFVYLVFVIYNHAVAGFGPPFLVLDSMHLLGVLRESKFLGRVGPRCVPLRVRKL